MNAVPDSDVSVLALALPAVLVGFFRRVAAGYREAAKLQIR